jgi:amino acid transporter
VGILVFGLVGIWIADSIADDFSSPGEAGTFGNFLGATVLGILAFKRVTTITIRGSEIKDPKRNVGRAIVFYRGLLWVNMVWQLLRGLLL